MKQTAIEWLMTKLQSLGITKEEHYELLCQLELEAKELEKKNMIDFADKYSDDLIDGGYRTPHQFYKTYINEK